MLLNGVQVELHNRAGETIDNNGIVVFDTILNNQSDDISYNTLTGFLTLTKAGTYYISWWVSTNGSSLNPTVSFAVAVNNLPVAQGASPSVTGQLTGSALITVNEAPATVSLINVNGDTVKLAGTSIQANLNIIELTAQ